MCDDRAGRKSSSGGDIAHHDDGVECAMWCTESGGLANGHLCDQLMVECTIAPWHRLCAKNRGIASDVIADEKKSQ